MRRERERRKEKEARPPNTSMGSEHPRPLPYSFLTLSLSSHRHIPSSLSSFFFFFLSHLLFYLSHSLPQSRPLSLSPPTIPPPSYLLPPLAQRSHFHSLLKISFPGRSSSLFVSLFVSCALPLSLGLGAWFCPPISSEVWKKRGVRPLFPPWPATINRHAIQLSMADSSISATPWRDGTAMANF